MLYWDDSTQVSDVFGVGRLCAGRSMLAGTLVFIYNIYRTLLGPRSSESVAAAV